MDYSNRTLGELIEHEVRSQGISITDFADKICCQRGNVYNIFRRGDKIDAAQLMLISRVLGHNFFEDLANNYNLIDLDNEEVRRDMQNRMAVSQFMETMPQILERLGLSPTIVFSQLDKVWGADLPDFGLADIPISFTIGQRLLDKRKDGPGQFLKVETYTSPAGCIVDAWTNELEPSVMLDIPLIFHTADEWEAIMRFAIHDVQPRYGILCSYGVPRIEKEIAYHGRKDM